MTLRPLGRVEPPAPSPVETLLGAPPEAPPPEAPAAAKPPAHLYSVATAAQTPARLRSSASSAARRSRPAILEWRPPRRWRASPVQSMHRAGGDLDALLRPRITRAVRLKCCPTQRLLLPKGAFIDCTLETAIDSTLAGHDDVRAGDRYVRRRRFRRPARARHEARRRDARAGAAGCRAPLRAVDRSAHADVASSCRWPRPAPTSSAGRGCRAQSTGISSSASAQRS